MSALDRLDLLGTVNLDQLNAQAELQTRVDRKYVVPIQDAAAVIRLLPGDTLVLELGGMRALRYESRYFDTPDLDSYLGAAHGRRRRFKVRARSYLDSEASFLEVKTRGGRSTTVKDRVPLSHDRRGLGDEARSYATEVLAAAGIPDAAAISARLRPILVTRYRRITLLIPSDDGRAPSRGTIDLDPEWSEIDGDRAFALPRSVIVETKSGRSAGALDRALWRSGHRPSALSKYGTGLAVLRSELPSNKWHRVLDRHFSDAAVRSPTLADRVA